MARVLIGYSACPLTRRAFEAHGHDVWTCDLLPARDVGIKHHQCDIWDAITNRGPWDFAVLHPMCTYLTCSAAWAYKDPDYVKYPASGYHQRVGPSTLVGRLRREARADALENFRRLDALPFPKAIENPGTNYASTAIRKPDQIVQPYQFGDDASKATGFWLSGGVPLLKPTLHHSARLVCPCGFAYRDPFGTLKGCPSCGGETALAKPRWGNQTDSGQNRLSPSVDRWLQRSETYPGIAAAMGDQWGLWLNNKNL